VKSGQDARRAGQPGDARPRCPLTRRGGRRNCRASHAIRTGSTGRFAPGIVYLAFLATMPLTGVAGLLPYTARRR